MKKMIAKALLVPMVSSLLPLMPTQAQAEQFVTCESRNGNQQYCRADTRNGARLSRQMSSSPCTEGQTWGYDRGGIWVTDGCRATFAVGGRGYGNDNNYGNNNNYGGGSRTITCESRNGEREYCQANTRGGVRVSKKLSKASCNQGSSWDYDRRGIWVDNGCRAQFTIGQGDGDDYGGSSSNNNNNKDDDISGKDIATAAAVIGGIAILGAILGNDQSQPAAPPQQAYGNNNYGGNNNYQSGGVPNWALGKFRGYNQRYKTNVELSIYQDGRVVGYTGGQQVNGYYQNQQLMMDGGYVLNLYPEGNGFRTRSGDGTQVVYSRVR